MSKPYRVLLDKYIYNIETGEAYDIHQVAQIMNNTVEVINDLTKETQEINITLDTLNRKLDRNVGR